MASICNDERAPFGVMSGHDRRTLSLSADVKRFEDNNATVSAFVSGPVQVIATGAQVAGNMMVRNPQLGAEYKFVLKDSPNFIGVGKGEDKLRLKINEIIAAAEASGEIDKLAWLGPPYLFGRLPNAAAGR